MKHETFITGISAHAASMAAIAPTLLRFEEPDFVTVFLEEMRGPGWRAALDARRVEVDAETGVMQVEQPVHRAFYLVVIDARCLTAGLPRIDPMKVVSAGVAIRRFRGGGWQGWMRSGEHTLGWQDLADVAIANPAGYDPDAKLRRARAEGRNAAVLSRIPVLAGAGDPSSEDTAPLFRAPPDVCANTGLSLLYGFLPVSSGETEPVPEETEPPFGLDDVTQRLPALFSAGVAGAELPPAGETVLASEMVKPEDAADADRGQGLRTLKSAVTWLAQECGAFSGGTAAQTLRAALNGQQVSVGRARGYFDFLADCYQVLMLRGWLNGSSASLPDGLRMPDDWPALDQTARNALKTAALAAMTERWADVAPLSPRYPAGNRRYRLDCFIRLAGCKGCPPEIVWSLPSEMFRIKPWYSGGDAAPIQIEMPPVSLDSLKDLKPNVAIKVPPELQQHMDRLDLDNLLKGKHTKTSVSFGMICGFSIPIITICAFIILQIFLQLLNIIFFWLPYVRICIPFPIIETEDE